MARQAASGYLSSPAPIRTMRMRRKTRARPFRIPSKVFLAYQSPPFLLRSVFRMSSHKNWNTKSHKTTRTRIYSSESDSLVLNMLSFHRRDSNEIFLKRPSTGTIKSTTNAHRKFTPRFTFCSTFSEIGIGFCQSCHVPSTRSVYFLRAVKRVSRPDPSILRSTIRRYRCRNNIRSEC